MIRITPAPGAYGYKAGLLLVRILPATHPKTNIVRTAIPHIAIYEVSTNKHIVEYLLQNNIIEQVDAILACATDSHIPVSCASHDPSLQILTEIAATVMHRRIGMTVLKKPCTPIITEALLQLFVKPQPLRGKAIAIEACGYADFMQRIYDNPDTYNRLPHIELPNLYQTIPVRATSLAITDTQSENEHRIRESIQIADVDVLYIEGAIGATAFINTTARTIIIEGSVFQAHTPAMQNLTLKYCKDIPKIDSSGCRNLATVHIIPESSIDLRDAYAAILLQVPTLCRRPQISTDKIPNERDLLVEHAPHLLSQYDYPGVYVWKPRLHRGFSVESQVLLETFVAGVNRLCDNGNIASYDPAAFEEVIRCFIAT